MGTILEYLKEHGEGLDSEIAEATGIPLTSVTAHISAMASRGEVIVCLSTRFMDGEEINGMRCRLAGYIPSASPGRRAKPPAKT